MEEEPKKKKQGQGEIFETIFSTYLGLYLMNEKLEIQDFRKVLKDFGPRIQKIKKTTGKVSSFEKVTSKKDQKQGKDKDNVGIEFHLVMKPIERKLLSRITMKLSEKVLLTAKAAIRGIPKHAKVQKILKAKQAIINNGMNNKVKILVESEGYLGQATDKDDVNLTVTFQDKLGKTLYKQELSFSLKTESLRAESAKIAPGLKSIEQYLNIPGLADAVNVSDDPKDVWDHAVQILEEEYDAVKHKGNVIEMFARKATGKEDSGIEVLKLKAVKTRFEVKYLTVKNFEKLRKLGKIPISKGGGTGTTIHFYAEKVQEGKILFTLGLNKSSGGGIEFKIGTYGEVLLFETILKDKY